MSDKHRAPAHQNSYAFKHNKNSRKTAKIMAMPNVGLCKRCHDIIEWRKKYRKYKPLTKPHKCNVCHLPKVKAAYHHVCTECANAKNICPKCMKNDEIYGKEEEALAELREQLDYLQNTKGQIPGISERERRAMLRELLRQISGKGGGDDDDEGEEEDGDAAVAGAGGADGDEEDELEDDASAPEHESEDDEGDSSERDAAPMKVPSELLHRPITSFEDAMAHQDAVGAILTSALRTAKQREAAMLQKKKAPVKPAAAPKVEPEVEDDDGAEPVDTFAVQERLRKLIVAPVALPKKA